MAELDRVAIGLAPVGARGAETAFDEVKYHALSIKRLLDHFAQLAGDDETMAHGVLKAIGETWYNVAKILEDSARKLKVRPKLVGTAIAVEMQEGEASSAEHFSERGHGGD